MSERRCEGCRWFSRYSSQLIGECRRYPPQHVHTQRGWLMVEQSEYCGEWQDGRFTPEQHEWRELMKQFAVAIAQGLCANPEDPSINVMRQAEAFVNDFYEAMQKGQQ